MSEAQRELVRVSPLARRSARPAGVPRRSGTSTRDEHLALRSLQQISQTPGPRHPGPGSAGPTGVLALQRLVGNRAVSSLLAPAPGPLPVVQRKKGKKKGKKRNKGKQNGAPIKVTTPPVTTPSSGGGIMGTLGSLGSWLWGKTTVGTEGEGEGEQSVLTKDQQKKVSFGEDEPEPEAPSTGLLEQLVNVPRVQIKLENEGEVLGGKGKMSGALSGGAQGGLAKGKIEWEKALFARERTPVDTQFGGGKGKLTSKGTFFAGLKGKVEGEGSYDGKGNYASKGKLAAFAGMEAKSETEVVLQVGGQETKFKGALGLTVGLGGELSYTLSFAQGVLKWGTKGKVALGAGASFEYELTLPVASVTSTLWSWLASAGSTAWANMTWENLEYLAGG